MAANITIAGDGSITVKQGTTCDWAYIVKKDNVAVDITAYSCSMMVRKTYDTADPLISLSVGAGITNGGADGTFALHLAPADTSAITFKGDSLECVYDVEVTDGDGVVTRIAEGTFTVTREVTR